MIEAELSKSYPGCIVLVGATIKVRPGTVHALVGENGAGKSTLVKILAGIVPADGGSLRVNGTPVELATWDRAAAKRAHVGIVQQHGALAPSLSVVENLVLGAEGGPVLALDEPAARLTALGTSIGLPVEPWTRADELGLGAAQRSEIAMALYHGAKLLILDEPTAVLAPTEVEPLLQRLRALAKDGTTIIIVTHKLDEVKAVADDVTVLRAGKTVATFSSASDTNAIAVAMVGAALPEPQSVPPPATEAAEMLSVTSAGAQLTVRAGEIVGIAGVDGNGQRELALAIAGLRTPPGSRVVIAGRDVTASSTAKRLANGLAYIPEDRHHGGLVLDASVSDNLALGRADITGRWRIDRARVARHAADRIAQLDIRPPRADVLVRTMSGGNQQKVVIGRELTRPGLAAVLACQPTRGVDLGAVVKIHDRLREAAKAGVGVLVISADLDELLALCHRIVVMLRGQIVGERAGEALRDTTTRSALGTLMTGAGAA